MKVYILALCIIGGQASSRLWGHDDKIMAAALLCTVLAVALIDIIWNGEPA